MSVFKRYAIIIDQKIVGLVGIAAKDEGEATLKAFDYINETFGENGENADLIDLDCPSALIQLLKVDYNGHYPIIKYSPEGFAIKNETVH